MYASRVVHSLGTEYAGAAVCESRLNTCLSMRIDGFFFPDDRLYLVEHQMWARASEDGTVWVGGTELGMNMAGDIYMCRVKSPGTLVEQGKGIALVELAKSIISVKSPLSGVVLQVNERLSGEPELLNRAPYEDGWMAVVKPSDWEREQRHLIRVGDALRAAVEETLRLFRLDNDPQG